MRNIQFSVNLRHIHYDKIWHFCSLFCTYIRQLVFSFEFAVSWIFIAVNAVCLFPIVWVELCLFIILSFSLLYRVVPFDNQTTFSFFDTNNVHVYILYFKSETSNDNYIYTVNWDWFKKKKKERTMRHLVTCTELSHWQLYHFFLLSHGQYIRIKLFALLTKRNI